ncbi:MAG: peptide ABC transporter substrate-binding protein, partial [Candidatus Melainabacteria bacterium HGW-Melainabacteria-1]
APTLLDAPKQAQTQIGRPGGVKTMAAYTPNTFNAYLAADNASTDIIGQMFLGLVTTNPITTDVEPSLAESWSISPDQKTYTFKLRPGLKWSDGKPLTADDVVFTYQEIIDNQLIPNNYRDGLLIRDIYPQVKKLDPLSVSFTIPTPLAPFLRALSDPILPKHVFQGKTQPDADGVVAFNNMWGIESKPAEVVVNGPWKLSRMVPGQQLELVRNPHYYLKDSQGQQLPYLDKLIYLFTPDHETELAWFNAGKTDAVTLLPDDLAHMTRKDAQIYNLGPATGTLFVMFNQSQAKDENGQAMVDPSKSAWFRNQGFRQALAHAIDKQRMVREIYHGLAHPQFSIISQTSPFYNPDTPDYAYDLDRAQALLAKAGFIKKGEALYDPKGKQVRFKLVTNTGNLQRDAACQILRQDWGKLGIQVDYTQSNFNLMVAQIDTTLDWEAMMIGLTGSAIEPHSGINTWKLDGLMHMFNMGHPSRWQGSSPTQYATWESRMLALYERAGASLDPAQRKQLYFQAQVLASEQLPFLYTVNQLSLVAVSNRLGNVLPSIHGGSYLNTVNWNMDLQFVK